MVWNILHFSHHIGNFIIPTDFHIFQRGRSTTTQEGHPGNSGELVEISGFLGWKPGPSAL